MFEKFKGKFQSPREMLNEANGSKAIGQLAVIHAHREKEAALSHVESNPAAKDQLTDAEYTGLKETVEAGHAELGSDIGDSKLDIAPHGEQFHIPDVEPTVTRAEGSVEEAVEAKEDEKIAA
jgi:hypothetical protein